MRVKIQSDVCWYWHHPDFENLSFAVRCCPFVCIIFLGTSSSFRWNTTGITVLGSPTLSFTSGVYVDANDTLYVVDEVGNHIIWKLLKNSSTPIRIAGLPLSPGPNASQLYNPQDVYIDSKQNLYVTDFYNYRVQKYANGSLNGITIVGTSGINGTGLNQLGGVRYFNFDPTETYMFIADSENHRIMRFFTNSTPLANGILVASGNGPGTANTQLFYPWAAYYSAITNFLYITNYSGGTVMQWLPGASFGTVIAGIAGSPGPNATQLNLPMDIKLDSYLNMYVVDSANHRVQMFCVNNQTGVTIAGNGTSGNGPTQLSGPRGIAFDSAMNMYIGDLGNSRV